MCPHKKWPIDIDISLLSSDIEHIFDDIGAHEVCGHNADIVRTRRN